MAVIAKFPLPVYSNKGHQRSVKESENKSNQLFLSQCQHFQKFHENSSVTSEEQKHNQLGRDNNKCINFYISIST